MKRAISLAVINLVLLLVGCNRQPKPDAVHILVTSHKYAFEPAEIHVKKGQDVVLEISTTDVQHGFAVEELGIDESVQKGRPALVNFRADKAGEYKVKCSIICGSGHDRMLGKIIVE